MRRIAPRPPTPAEYVERGSTAAPERPIAEPRRSAPRTPQLRTITHASDIASGRGVTYEWEYLLVDVLDRLEVVEDGGGGSVSGGGTSYIHTQDTPAATWNIQHDLNTKPSVVVVSTGGQQLIAEVHYTDDVSIVVIFGSPYAGSAYLHG